MDQHHHRQVSGSFQSRRKAGVTLQLQSVAGGERDRLLGGHPDRVDPAFRVQQPGELAGLAIEQVEVARVAVRGHVQDAEGAVAGAGNDARVFAREVLHQPHRRLRCRRVAIEQRHAWPPILETDADDLVVGGTEDQRVRLDRRVAPQLGQLAGGGVPATYTEAAGLRRTAEVGMAVVRVEGPRKGAACLELRQLLPAVCVYRMRVHLRVAAGVESGRKADAALMVGHERHVATGGVDDVRDVAAAQVHPHRLGQLALVARAGPGADRHECVVGIAGNRRDERRRAVLAVVALRQPPHRTAALAVAVQQQRIAAIGIHAEQLAGGQRYVVAAHVFADAVDHAGRRGPPEIDDVVAFTGTHDMPLHVGQVDQRQRALPLDQAQCRQVLPVRRNLHLRVFRMPCQIGKRHRRGVDHARTDQQQGRNLAPNIHL